MRWLIMVIAILGAAAGLAWPTASSGQGTGYWYEATMAPPSGSTGQSVPLTCGWHTGACDDPNEVGPNLDWAVSGGGSLTVHFRGWFYRTATPQSPPLQGYIFNYIVDPSRCDHFVVDVYEDYSGTVRYGMHYVHANTNQHGQWFDISAGSPPTWNSRSVGSTVYDAGSCSWTGYHVHEFAAYVDVYNTDQNGDLPTGDYCIPLPCNYYYNDLTWTNWTSWEEGS